MQVLVRDHHAMIAASGYVTLWNTEEAASGKRATITVGLEVSAVGRPDMPDVRGPDRPAVDDPPTVVVQSSHFANAETHPVPGFVPEW
jgi:hypothetical protein